MGVSEALTRGANPQGAADGFLRTGSRTQRCAREHSGHSADMREEPLRLYRAAENDSDDLRRLVRAGDLERVRSGTYAVPIAGNSFEAQRVRAIRRMHAVVQQFTTDMCLSHQSAALLRKWPLLGTPEATHITQQVNARARGDSDVIRHRLDLPTRDRDEIDGMPVTSPERTALDCARSLTALGAVMLLDAALASGVDRHALDVRMRTMRGHRGIRRARTALAHADPRSESPGESVTRFRIRQAGLPEPALQVEVRTRLGVFRMDMGWPELRVGLEYDGLVKYTRLAEGDPSAVVVAEKRRQDALEHEGWRVMRVCREDVRSANRLWEILGPVLLDPLRR